eukprot:4748017-Amphidinium_carterae.1
MPTKRSENEVLRVATQVANAVTMRTKIALSSKFIHKADATQFKAILFKLLQCNCNCSENY